MTAPRSTRDAVLDAAADEVVAHGWDGLRLQAVAASAGVSRQTVYNLFRHKHGLAQALVLRLTERFLDGVERALASREDVREQWVAAIRYTLDTAADDPLLKSVLTADGRTEFLPLLTSEAAPVVVAARERLAAAVTAARPRTDPGEAAVAAETATRLAISHIVLPLHPAERATAQIATVVHRFLGSSSPESS